MSVLSLPKNLQWRNEDVEIEHWRWPEGYDVSDVCERITTGPGWVLLKKMFSDKDVEMARERILINKVHKTKGGRFSYTDDSHNNFNGLTWGLLSRGKIFAKVSFNIFSNKYSRYFKDGDSPGHYGGVSEASW